MPENSIPNSQLTRFRIALILAVVADALQFIFLPLFVEGLESPAEDVLDFGVAGALIYLLGWHWEFLPSFFAKLVPGVDLVPLVDARGCECLSDDEADRGQHGRRRGSSQRLRSQRLQPVQTPQARFQRADGFTGLLRLPIYFPMQKVILRPEPMFMLVSACSAVSGDSLETQNYSASLAPMLEQIGKRAAPDVRI